MGYFKGGIFRRGHQAVLKAAGAEGASSNHASARSKGASVAQVVVDVTAASGTSPTLVVVVEGSVDGGASWVELGRIGSDGYRPGSLGAAPSNFTGAGTVRGVFAAMPLIRSRSVVGGTTPSFTYSVSAELS